MKVEIVEAEERTIAIIIRKSFNELGTTSFTNPELPLQVVIQIRASGHKIPAHIHLPTKSFPQEGRTRHEILHLDTGSAEVRLFTKNGNFVKSIDLEEGDTILIMEGHEIIYKSDVRVLEIKEGQYAGLEKEKTLL
jgi:hypothetical protein